MKYYIGVDIGGMSIKTGIINEKGDILAKTAFVTLNNGDFSENAPLIAKAIEEVAKTSGIALSQIEGIGMGIPGMIDDINGEIVYSNNIKIEHCNIVKEMSKYIDLPVKINNDANCACLGETIFGSAKGLKNVVFITLGTGVGTGILIDGKILSGAGGAGGEGGHTMLILGGEPCTCGRRGCFEAYASATALVKQTVREAERDPNGKIAAEIKTQGKANGKISFKLAREGDINALKVTDTYIGYVAHGIINLVNIFRPEAVIIGGGISNEGEYLIERIRATVNGYSYGGKFAPPVKVEKACLLNDAGILGAAALVI